MNLVPYLPYAAAVVAILAFFARDGIKPTEKSKKPEAPLGAFLVLAALVAVLMVGLTLSGKIIPDGISAGYGMGIGVCASAVAYGLGLISAQREAGRAAPIAIGALMVALLPLFPGTPAPMAVVFGSAVGAWILSIGKNEDPNPWAMRTAVAIGAIVAANALGAQLEQKAVTAHAGTMLGISLALAGVVLPLIPKIGRGLALVALTAGVAYLIGDKVFGISETLVVCSAGALVALIVSWLVPDEEKPNTLRLSLATLIWISAGTAGFSQRQGFGMALLFLVAAATLLLMGNRRALLSMGPLGAIVFFRVFRETNLDATKALDIGQHYAMVGLVVGAVLPVLAQEWLTTVARRGGFLALIGGLAWVLVLLGLPIGAAVIFGAKGVVGYLFGLGLASLAEGIKGERSAHALSLGLGLSGVMTLVYEGLQPHLDLTRDEKVNALMYIGAAVVVAGLLIAVLSGEMVRPKEEVSA